MKITHEQVDEIINSFETLELDENSPTLALNVRSLRRKFNALIDPLLKSAELDIETLALVQELLLIDNYQIYSEDDVEFFVNIFGDSVGLFGASKTDENFKILRLCFTDPDNQGSAQAFDLVFGAFVKILLPHTDADDFLVALNKNPSVTLDGMKFSIVREGNLNTLTVLAD